MSEITIQSRFFDEESLELYCRRLSKKNNVVLYKLEDYLGKKLLDNEELAEIRDIILTVSAEIKEIPNNIKVSGDKDEGLQ